MELKTLNLKVLNEKGEAISTLAAPQTLFGRDYNEALVHQIVVAYQANARLGTRAQKDRSEVRHSTRKPWRQKGTGRARAGMTSSPLWRGGGKMFRAALCSILSKLAQDDRIAVVDDLTVPAPRTKLLAQKLKAMGLGSVLIITESVDENLGLASRNLKNVMVVEPRYADPVSMIYFDKVVVTRPAIAKLEQMWGQA